MMFEKFLGNIATKILSNLMASGKIAQMHPSGVNIVEYEDYKKGYWRDYIGETDECATKTNIIMPLTAYNYYSNVSALATAVDMIADPFTGLPLTIKDIGDNGALNPDHDIIKAIKNPGSEVKSNELLRELAISMLLTNECWPIFRGGYNKMPVAISYVRPYCVSAVDIDQTDGLPNSIRTDQERDRRVYYKNPIKGEIRYLSRDKKNEIIPIIGVVEPQTQYRGFSKLCAIEQDLKILWHGARHNFKQLKNDLMLAALISLEEGVPEHRRREIEKSLKELLNNSKANGLYFMPYGMKTFDLTQKNRDAEYTEAKIQAKNTIFEKFSIPLPLVTAEVMNYSNYYTAQAVLYDTPISNLVNKIYPALMRNFSLRLGIETDILEMTFNEHAIPALQYRKVQMLKELSETHSLSTNEKRDLLAYGGVENGDLILGPSNLAPLPLEPDIEDFE